MDVPDKPGWIVDAVDTSTHNSTNPTSREIVFPITLSTVQPMMRLSFLRSYNATMGKLTCCITRGGNPMHKCDVSEKRFEFNGHWHDATSQGVAVSVPLFSDMTSNRETLQDAVMKRNVLCVADEGKFKIIGLVGC